MKGTIKIKSFKALTTKELYEILKARFKVFVIEQRCFYLDMDDVDYNSVHFFMEEKDAVIAYARLFPDIEYGVANVGRMLTIYRQKGLGRKIMECVIHHAKSTGFKELRLHAQTHAINFYMRLGFQVCSDVFEEAEMPHIKMKLLLSANPVG